MIANARMYSVAAPVAQAWRELFARVAQRAGVDLPYLEHAAPAPVSALWARPDCGCVFMCGFPYVNAAVRPRLLAAPVPSPERYGQCPVYFTEFIVRADAPAAALADTFGMRLAHMLPESNSGYNAPRHFLLRQAAPGTRAPYRPADTPTPTPNEVIDAVLAGRADVGVVDSYVLDLLRLHVPGRMARLRTLAVTPASPVPALVASPALGDTAAARIRMALLDLHRDAGNAALLASLCLARFALVEEADYAVLAGYAREADAAGFALTGTGVP
ncbi:phosphate/phosphite/phosphonate ABC transporter substrate-binding protein [Cupriavidus basilensis]|uniref:phosphate/phosphite/phosphonate ABC transporter substrate-binding protein n=1 Tax=Cupriavidus basilensis TaxID=68895 RepID=UPI000750718D|nr:PhnD/SsuA/transferrin family substrate-binding protein [Cupriavidus basilensis]